MHRRRPFVFVQSLGLLLALTLAAPPLSHAAEESETTTMTQPAASIYEVPVPRMSDDASTAGATLAEYRGQVLLLANVASQCGFTPQYEQLEALHDKYAGQGLRVVGLPSNDFGGQEPGTEAEIVKFCAARYSVSFPLRAKSHARGAEIAPIFAFLTQPPSPFPGEVQWNFEKFVIARDGRIVGRFKSSTRPDDPQVVGLIERELAKPAPAAE